MTKTKPESYWTSSTGTRAGWSISENSAHFMQGSSESMKQTRLLVGPIAVNLAVFSCYICGLFMKLLSHGQRIENTEFFLQIVGDRSSKKRRKPFLLVSPFRMKSRTSWTKTTFKYLPWLALSQKAAMLPVERGEMVGTPGWNLSYHQSLRRLYSRKPSPAIPPVITAVTPTTSWL